MGQHKRNPNCALAREGKLSPKKRPMSKRELRDMVGGVIVKKLLESLAKPISRKEAQG